MQSVGEFERGIGSLELNQIYNMNCLDGLRLMDAETIDLTITSPPYDNLRNYNGYQFDFENIAKELFRITKPCGVVVWVVGDATIKGSETGTSFSQALFFKDLGFNLHDTMIYQKQNYMPLTHNRYEQSFEYMFVLSKGKPKTFHPIMIETKGAGHEYNLSRKGYCNSIAESAQRRRNQSIVIKSQKIKSNIFTYAVGSRKVNHPAPFPEQLAADQIVSWSNEGDIVLDPFMGSGTTAKMALKNNRQYIGFEISKEYCDIANARVAESKFKN